MAKVPRLKKKISSFLTKEDGKISKESLVKTGIILCAAAVASMKTADALSWGGRHTSNAGTHVDGLGLSADETKLTASHGHNHPCHASHSSHGSHGSHGSHSSFA